MNKWVASFFFFLNFIIFASFAKEASSRSSTTYPSMELDPQTASLLKMFYASSPVQPLPEQFNVKEMRQAINLIKESHIPVKKIQDLAIPGPLGVIPIRIYTPEGKGPFPVYVSFEGGGWVAGNLASNDRLCREICNRAQCLVISVDYRKAPENPFPKPLEDCYAATLWVAQNIKAYNGDPSRLAVGGDSAGGNLAAAVTLLAKERKKPVICCQVLMYPVINFDFDTLSYYQNATGYFLTRTAMQWFWSAYLQGANGKNPLASPIQASLENLPSALMIAAFFDPLRDEDLAYAHQLKVAGVPVITYTYPTVHGFISFTDQLELSRQALNDIAHFLQRELK